MFSRRRAAPAGTTTTTTTTHRTSPATNRSLLSRLTGSGPKTRSHTTAGTTHSHHTRSRAQPVHHKRKTSIGDKVSGALLKLKGSLTGRPGVKAAGTKRMRGTDGRGSRHTAAPMGTTATGRRRRARRNRY